MSLLALHIAQVAQPFIIRPQRASLMMVSDDGYVRIDPAVKQQTKSNTERSLAVRRLYLPHYFPGITARELATLAGKPYISAINWLRTHHFRKVEKPGKEIQWWLPDEWLDEES